MPSIVWMASQESSALSDPHTVRCSDRARSLTRSVHRTQRKPRGSPCQPHRRRTPTPLGARVPSYQSCADPATPAGTNLAKRVQVALRIVRRAWMELGRIGAAVVDAELDEGVPGRNMLCVDELTPELPVERPHLQSLCTTNSENLVRCARFYNRFCGKVLESRPSESRRIAS